MRCRSPSSARASGRATLSATTSSRGAASLDRQPQADVLARRVDESPQMAKERALAPVIVETWLAAWAPRDPFCDESVRHLQSLIPDDHCFVVVTLGVGALPRSLLFRRWRHVVPVRRDLAPHGRWLPDDATPAMIEGPDAPAAPRPGQLWHQTGGKAHSVFRWDGTDWTLYGALRDDPIISKQGTQECGFMEALASAHDLATWNQGAEIIYTFDGSTWGNA